MHTVYLTLEAASRGDKAFRTFVADLARSREVPGAMASRLTGVPGPILLEPNRGIQFTPVGPDLLTLSVRPREDYLAWLGSATRRERELTPRVYDQEWVRDALTETSLKENFFTSTPVPRNGERCYHICIPELPGAHRARSLGPRYYQMIHSWEEKYLLPASTETS